MSVTVDFTLFALTVLFVGFISTLIVVVLVSRAVRSEFKQHYDDNVMTLLNENKIASERLSGQLEVVRRLMNGDKK